MMHTENLNTHQAKILPLSNFVMLIYSISGAGRLGGANPSYLDLSLILGTAPAKARPLLLELRGVESGPCGIGGFNGVNLVGKNARYYDFSIRF